MKSSPFGRAFLATLLVFAALNAMSYFVRSGQGMLPGHIRGIERIGFPWLVWQDAAEPNGGFATVALGPDGYFDYGALTLNIGAGLAASFLVGLLAMLAFQSKARARPIDSGKPAQHEAGGPPQFSLRSLLLATAAVSVVLAFQRVATHAFWLAAIYLLGPSCLVCCAWLACRRKRAERMVVVFTVPVMLVAAALAVGTQTENGDFTRVLLDLYVYWVPQCVVMAAVHAAVTPWLRGGDGRGL